MILDEPNPTPSTSSSSSPSTSSSPSQDAPSFSPSQPPSISSPSSQAGTSMRVRVGSRLAAVPAPSPAEEIKLEDFDGPYQLSEFLSRLIAQDGGRGKDVQRLVQVPGEGAEGDWVDKNVWLYEHLLRLPPDLTPLITSLLNCCTPQTCPDMRAGEWQYLCAAHPHLPMNQDCAAINYILHALDSITSQLNSSRVFPSRLSIPPNSVQHLKNIARRLSRVFGHAYSFHREVFEACEEETSLYRRFLALSEQFDLVHVRELAIPSERFLRPRGEADDFDETSSPDASSLKTPAEDWGYDGRGTTRGPGGGRGGGRTVQEFAIGEANEDDDESSSDEDEEEEPSTTRRGSHGLDLGNLDDEENGVLAGSRRGSSDLKTSDILTPSPSNGKGPLNTALPVSPSPSPSPPRAENDASSRLPLAASNTLMSQTSLPSAISSHTHLKPVSSSLPPKAFLGSPIMLNSSAPTTSPINAVGKHANSPPASRSPPASLIPIPSPLGSPSKTTLGPSPSGIGLSGGTMGRRTRTTTAIKNPSTFTVAAGGKSIGRREGGRMVKAAAGGKGAVVVVGETGGWREGREKALPE